jgi:hypothetical protein
VEVNVRFRYISIKGDWESSKAEAVFLNTHTSLPDDGGLISGGEPCPQGNVEEHPTMDEKWRGSLTDDGK